MAITTIPIPPSHCIIDLHSKILLGLLSKFVIVVEPVVVIPDILSKKASLNDKDIGDNINGIDPNNAIMNHAIDVNKKVCCKFNLYSFSIFESDSKAPKKIVIKEEEIKL